MRLPLCNALQTPGLLLSLESSNTEVLKKEVERNPSLFSPETQSTRSSSATVEGQHGALLKVLLL